MYEGHTVGAVVPAYNEAGQVGAVLETVPPVVDRVYAIDDGSTDRTWAEIRTAASRLNADPDAVAIADGGSQFERRFVPIQHRQNRGVGGAIKTGYRRALDDGIDVTVVLAGDGQMDPDRLDRLLDPIVAGEADYVKGNRLHSPSTWAGMPPFRLFGNAILSLLTKIASGYWGIGDPQNGYTAISRRALEAVDVDGMYEFYGYCNDLLVKLNVAGMRVADVTMPAVYGDEVSHIRYSTYIPRVSLMLLRNFLWRLLVTYAVDDAHPVLGLYALGASGLASAVGGALRDRLTGADRERSLVPAVLGAVALLAAMAWDRAANADLDVGRVGESGEDDP